MEQATSRSRGCTLDQLIKKQAGQTVERYGRFQLNGSTAINIKYQVSKNNNFGSDHGSDLCLESIIESIRVIKYFML